MITLYMHANHAPSSLVKHMLNMRRQVFTTVILPDQEKAYRLLPRHLWKHHTIPVTEFPDGTVVPGFDPLPLAIAIEAQ